MTSVLKTSTIRLSEIQVSGSRLRYKNTAALHKAMQTIRRSGQQRPLIIDPDRRLLSDTVSYLALKALEYGVVEVFTLVDTSPVAVRCVSRLLDRCDAIRRETASFNEALASLDGILNVATGELVLDFWPVMLVNTDQTSARLLPAVASREGDRTPLDV